MFNNHHHLILIGLLAVHGCLAAQMNPGQQDQDGTYEVEQGQNTVFNHRTHNVNVNRIRLGSSYNGNEGQNCSGESSQEQEIAPSQCRLWLPFENKEIKDQSAYQYEVRAKGTFSLEQDTTEAAHGTGSLLLYNARLKVPELRKAFSCDSHTTMCFFWRCKDCRSGTIFSNRRYKPCRDQKKRCGQDYSLTVEVIRKGPRRARRTGLRVTASFRGKRPVYLDVFPERRRPTGAPSPQLPYGFDQYCIQYDGRNLTVSVNSNFKTVHFTTTGRLRRPRGYASFGRDLYGGNAHGWLDEVLICDRVLTKSEINAHYAGQLAMEYAGMIPATSTLYNYRSVLPTIRPQASVSTVAPVCGHNSYWNAGEQLQPLLGIVGGREALDWEFPWTALIRLPKSNHYCHGSLVKNNTVITSGHCCLQIRRDRADQDIYAYLGTRKSGVPTMDRGRNGPDGYFPEPDYSRKQKIIREDIHPNYNEKIVRSQFDASSVNRTRSGQYFNSEHNLCVVTLEDPVDEGEESWRVVPICLPDCTNDLYQCKTGDTGLVSGFGQQAYNEWDWSFMGQKQRVITVPRISDAACKYSLDTWYPQQFQEQPNFRENFCAGFVNKGINSAACYTDDGTGFICPRSGFFTLQGVLSGWDCSATPGSPSQFANICGATNWDFITNTLL